MLKVFDFEHTPIVDIVNEILVDASSRGASDIHFDPKDNVLQIRIRIDGELINYATVPEEYVKNLITRIKIISGMNITESRLPQDGAIKGVVKDIELDLRVSSINTNKGEKIVIRILDYTLSINGIEQLGFSDYNYKKVIEMINEPNGIILVTGATGTGKTTTVYSMLQRLSNETTNIMSIEDPVEMDIENVNQIQVNADIGLTFATALRSILRQDPNIIMIGEIRDSETATIAIRASVTGHLVLSTLHTNDSLSTIERLMDMDVEKYLLAEALEGIISQKLARRLCPHCKKLRKTTTYEKDLIKKTLNMDVDEIYEAVGCEHCNHGYKGRIAFQEVLKIDQKIQDALSMNIRKDKLRNLVYNEEVITLLQDGMIKVLRGDTTIEELLRLVEFEDDSIITYNLSRDILNNELNKQLEFYDDKEIIAEEDIPEDIIIPETNDVIIDSISDTNDIEEIEDIEPDINNMENLDNDDKFIDKIDEVISEKKAKKKKEKKKKKKNIENNNSNEPLDNMESLDNEDIPKNIDESDNIENNIISENEIPIESTDNDSITQDEIVENNNDDLLDNMESLDNEDIPNIIEDSNDIDEIIDNNTTVQEEIVKNSNEDDSNKNKKGKKRKKRKKRKKKKQLKEDSIITDDNSLDSVIPELNDIVEDTNNKINDSLINDVLDEVKNSNNDDDILNSDDTFITKIEKYVKNNKNSDEQIDNIDIIDEVSPEDTTTYDTTQPVNDEITDMEIKDLEDAIDNIKVSEEKENLEDNTIDNELEDTIKISVNENGKDDDELNVSEVITVNKSSKDDDEMASLDYNTNFIDKIYDTINNTGEFKPIEKNNIDYEKVERLESMKEDIGSRVSRMMNKKRYRKKKDE